MGGGQYHQSQAFHYWNSPLNQASTPRFFHSITGFAIGRLRWPRTRLHPPLLQRKAAHHPRHQPSARHHHLQERGEHHHLQERGERHHLQERGGPLLLQANVLLQVRSGQRAHLRKVRLRALRRGSQRARQVPRRSASADSESNLDYERQRYLMPTIDTKTSWVGPFMELFSKRWKRVARKNLKLSLTNVRCAAQ